MENNRDESEKDELSYGNFSPRNDASLALVLKCRRSQFNEIQDVLKEHFPNIFICLVKKADDGVRFWVLIQEQLNKLGITREEVLRVGSNHY